MVLMIVNGVYIFSTLFCLKKELKYVSLVKKIKERNDVNETTLKEQVMLHLIILQRRKFINL
jgi:hypothetical protein